MGSCKVVLIGALPHWGAALGLFGSGPAHFVCPSSHFRPWARRTSLLSEEPELLCFGLTRPLTIAPEEPARRLDAPTDPTRGGHHRRHLATEPLAHGLRSVRLPVHLRVARDEVRVRSSSHGMNSSRTPGRRCSRIGETCVAPASIAARTTSRSCSGRSVMPGRIGAIRTPVGMPACVQRPRPPRSAPADAACRARSHARPSSSSVPIENAAETSVTSAARCSRSRSRRIRVPFVRIENGFR